MDRTERLFLLLNEQGGLWPGGGGTDVRKDISVLKVSILCSSTVLTLRVSDSSPNCLFEFRKIEAGAGIRTVVPTIEPFPVRSELFAAYNLR